MASAEGATMHVDAAPKIHFLPIRKSKSPDTSHLLADGRSTSSDVRVALRRAHLPSERAQLMVGAAVFVERPFGFGKQGPHPRIGHGPIDRVELPCRVTSV